MELMFEVISRQKFAAGFPSSHVFSEAGGFIGRAEECEWILPDKGRRISRKHAAISCDGESFFIEDVGRNGIFVEPGREALTQGVPHRIEHGSSYILGTYSIQARLLQRPDAYIRIGAEEDWGLSLDNQLSIDPLQAMEQQELFEAKRRLGYYGDLLREEASALNVAESDHSCVTTDSLLPVSMTSDPGVADLPEDWDSEDDEIGAPPIAKASVSEMEASVSHEPPTAAEAGLAVSSCETEEFFRTLGFSGAPESPQVRADMLLRSAEIILAAVDGLHHCLRNQAECKNDLRLPVTTMRLSGNNPLKFTPTPRMALEHLLGNERDGMLPAGKAVRSGFSDLHGHHMGLLAGARASVRAVLEKTSPEAVERRLDMHGSVHFSRKSRLWYLFRKMHGALLDDHEGFAALFLNDFARAYELQVRTLDPLPERSLSEGDQ